MAASSIATADAHVLVFPYPAQGHIIPLLDLTHQLAARGLKLTVLVTPKNRPLLNPLLSVNTSVETLVLPFPGHPSIPDGVENVKDLPSTAASVVAVMRALADLHDPLLAWFKNHPSPPVAIISDMFLGWTQKLASRLGIPRVVFSPSGAMAFSVICSMWSELPERTEVVQFPKVPNSPKYPWWQLSQIYRFYMEGGPDSGFVKDSFRANVASWGLVINSFCELERVYLDHLDQRIGNGGGRRVWAVGPLLPPGDAADLGRRERGGSSSISVDSILSWLDTCKDKEVVYLCFGSQAVLTNGQMEKLALGLEGCGVRFVWCVKEPTGGQVAGEGGYGVVPSGFEDRVAGRGMVIRGWAPQELILTHRAVGAFLTHCGWNSVLEGVVAGVAMLAWPMGADQFLDADLLVEELKVAKRVCEGATAVPDSAELARLLAESVSSNSELKERAAEWRRAALEAINAGGRSFNDLESFVKQIVKLV